MKICAVVGIVAITSAITYAISYNVAMHKFNNIVLDVNKRQAMYSKLSEIDQIVRENYFGDIDETFLKNNICSGYINGLKDNYAKYLSADQYKKYLLEKEQKCFGIGIRILKNENNQIQIIDVQNESVAEKCGLQKNDIILSIDDNQTINMEYAEILDALKGPKGSKINLKILRTVNTEDGTTENKEMNIEVTFQKYTEKTISYKTLSNANAYIYIHNVNSNTLSEFDNAISNLKNAGCNKFIIDLRNSYSEESEYAAQILNRILPKGDIISKVNNDEKEEVLYTSDDTEFNYPIAVLINDKTENVLEVMALAIKDYNKGILIGQKTAGNSKINEIYPLKDGSAIKIWTSNYKTPKSAVITNEGVLPDIEVIMPNETRIAFNKEALNENDDNQLNTAIEKLT